MAVNICALMCSHLAAFRIATNIRQELVDHMAIIPDGFVEQTGSGKLRRIIIDSSAATETYLAHMLPDMVNFYVTPICLFVLLFVFDWRFDLASLIPLALGFWTMFKMAGPSMAQDMKQYQDALEGMNNEAVEYVRGIPVVKTFGQTIHSFHNFKAAIDNDYSFCVEYCRKCRTPMVLYTLLSNSVFAFLILAALFLTGNGAVDRTVLSNLIFYSIFTPAITTAMSKVLFASENNMVINDALNRIHFILDTKGLPVAAIARRLADASVKLQDVSFAYPKTTHPALSHVSLNAPADSMIALVGPSGSGKSTIASLIARFWDVDAGVIEIGGVNVKEIDPSTLADWVCSVFQDSHLLKTSILENVKMGKPEASREDIAAALHAAQCDEILAKFPDGMDTVIGTKGIYLSGGEQQCIAIARAMLKNAPILVLDEATAFADPENEVLVQKAFRKLAKGKTVIMIAHRLTTIQSVDQIYVLDDGQVVEHGSHRIFQ